MLTALNKQSTQEKKNTIKAFWASDYVELLLFKGMYKTYNVGQ
jgi:hypothetical protein